MRTCGFSVWMGLTGSDDGCLDSTKSVWKTGWTGAKRARSVGNGWTRVEKRRVRYDRVRAFFPHLVSVVLYRCTYGLIVLFFFFLPALLIFFHLIATQSHTHTHTCTQKEREGKEGRGGTYIACLARPFTHHSFFNIILLLMVALARYMDPFLCSGNEATRLFFFFPHRR